MQSQTFYTFKFLIYVFICLSAKGAFIYKAPSMFYSRKNRFIPELCVLGHIGPASDGTLTCTTAEEQSGIIRIGLILAEYSKSEDVEGFNEFSATTALVPGPATSFNIQVQVIEPTEGMRLSFFLVIIKSQPTTSYVDLFDLGNCVDNKVWSSGSPLDTTSSSVKTNTKTFDISNLIFASGTSGYQVHAYTTSFKLKTVDGSWDDVTVRYTLAPSITGTSASVLVTTGSETRITQLRVMVLVINRSVVPTSTTLYNIAAKTSTVSLSDYYNLTSAYSAYGPSYNSKCIVGTIHLTYEGDEYIDLFFTKSSFNNYESYSFAQDDDSIAVNIRIFCFGHLKECSQSSVYMDTIDSTCYTASTCPLPVPTPWTPYRLCPTCAQLICKTCQVSNRSHCLDCDPTVTNSYLSSGMCVCNTNYLPKTTFISTSSQGQWNNLANSLSQCLPNCTAFIPGCQQTTCTTTTFCTACLPDYLLNYQSASSQNCPPCSAYITNCLKCTDQITCTKCADGFWLKLPNLCEPCSSQISQCTNCSNTPVCSSCNSGYNLNSGLNKCQCDPIANALPNCASCSIPTLCASCVTQFYLNTSDTLCHPCTQVHTACLTCSGPQFCNTCQPTFYPTLNPDNTKTCKLCTQIILNCQQCTSPTVCTNCVQFYGVTSSGICQKCDALVDSHCQTCQDNTACLSCDSLTVLFQSKCKFCKDHIQKCKTCQLDPTSTFLQCTLCQEGYYLITNPSTGKTSCRLCLYQIDFCSFCQGNTCYSCISPYLLANDGTCSLCEAGYEKVGKFCSKLPGCQNPIVLFNRTVVCIACLETLYFQYDPINKKCICQNGFKEFNQIGLLAQCLPVCGDGLVISQFEECDDKNTQNRDGCNEFCKKEQDYVCSMEQPSKCVLHANFNTFVFNYVYRILGENKGILSFSIEPKHDGLKAVDWSKVIQMNFSTSSVDPKSLQYSYSPQTGQLLVTVPYTEQLEGSTLFTTLTFDPKVVVSHPSSLSSVNQLKGINASLTFEKDSLLSSQKNINIISTILIALLLMQFYLGSFVHKMIGLQTIQVIQSIYFVRMMMPGRQTSLLNAMNIIQYSASGYENAELIFGDISQLESYSMSSSAPEFTQIRLKRYFLLNTNISLIPLLIVIIIYLITIYRKYSLRSQCLNTKDQLLKDQYTQLRRSSQRIYDNFMFPFLMMFYLIVFFCAVLQLQNTQKLDSVQYQMLQRTSFGVHLLLAQSIIAIYCYEAINSYHQYTKYKMTSKQRQRCGKSLVQQLEHDDNYPNRPNYHPLYVFIYMIYYLILSITMTAPILIPSFNFGLDLALSVTVVYFIIIWIWEPYHQSAHIHNTLLKVYYGTVVVFVAVGYLFAKAEKLPVQVYIAVVYSIMALMGLILCIGFVRIFIERQYRKSLERDNSLLEWNAHPHQQTVLKNSHQPAAITKKKQPLLVNNSYSFKGQLKQMRRIPRIQQPFLVQPCGIQLPIPENDRDISPQEQNLLINKIRRGFAFQKQNILIEAYNNSILKNEAKSSISNILPEQYGSHEGKNMVDDRVTVPSPLSKHYFNSKNNPSQLQLLKNKMRRQWIVGGFRQNR